MPEPRAQPGVTMTMAGVTLLIVGFALLVLALFDYSSYSLEGNCRSATGGGSSSGGTAGRFGVDHPDPPPAQPGRCSGRVNDLYYDVPVAEADAALERARDSAYRGGARVKLWTGFGLLAGAFVTIRAGRIRAERGGRTHPSDELP